jgi:hypothetical protein
VTLAHLSPDVLVLKQLIPEPGDLARSAERARFVDLAEVSARFHAVNNLRNPVEGERSCSAGMRRDELRREGTRLDSTRLDSTWTYEAEAVQSQFHRQFPQEIPLQPRLDPPRNDERFVLPQLADERGEEGEALCRREGSEGEEEVLWVERGWVCCG